MPSSSGRPASAAVRAPSCAALTATLRAHVHIAICATPSKASTVSTATARNSTIVAPAWPRPPGRSAAQTAERIGHELGDVGLHHGPQRHDDADAHHEEHHPFGDRTPFVALDHPF